MGSPSFGEQKPAVAAASPPAVLSGGSRDRRSPIGCFYEKVFGWNIRHRDSAHPSFDDATGDVSGSFTTGRKISPEPGLLPYVWVESIDATLNRAAAEGGV